MYVEIKFRMAPDLLHLIEHCERLFILLFTEPDIMADIFEGAVIEMDPRCVTAARFRRAEADGRIEVQPQRIFVLARREREHHEAGMRVDDDRTEPVDVVHVLQVVAPGFQAGAVLVDQQPVEPRIRREDGRLMPVGIDCLR